ncbi:MAG: sulfatase-like hydrolase/transferase, partial [Candidatus Zixiibacteriota bacterium]
VPVEVPNDPNYNFMTDMTNKAIEWVNFQQALTPSKPFFMYFAPGATHAPHHVPKEWIAKYKGKFDQGWDKLREETLARQIKLGVVPSGTKLAPKPAGVKDWDTLSADEKRLSARQMETFAAFSEYADTEIGRLIDSLREIGQLDNTLIFYIAGDNGTSAEGGPDGTFNEYSSLNGVPESVQDMLKRYDEWGGPTTYPHMAIGWAIAGDTPFTWAKQVASDFGGTRNGMVVHWPKRFKGKGEVRSQFSHVIDVVPTILEATGLPQPKFVNGVAQVPIQGTSLIYTFGNSKARDRHTTQYFEMAGNRALYKDGWFARVIHKTPWGREPIVTLQNDVWQLYDTSKDFSLVNDLSKTNPGKLREMQREFMKVASENHVLPIDDRSFERLNPAIAGRPDLMAGRTSLTLRSGMRDLGENAFINVKNKSKVIAADVNVPAGGNGVILAQGGRFGGWSLYLKDGKPTYTYNYLGLQHMTIAGAEALRAGKANIRFEFAYDGGGMGKGGTGTLSVDGRQVATGRIERTQAFLFSLDETADVGLDGATPVVEDYGSLHGQFNGTIDRVTIDVK